MADKTRVRILRTVQGENQKNDELEILVKGSVVELTPSFAAELMASKAAEPTEDKVVSVPLHPEEKASKSTDAK